MTTDHPAPVRFEDVGLVELTASDLMVKFRGFPGKYVIAREGMGNLIAGTLMKEEIQVKKRDDSQAVLFGTHADLSHGKAILSTSGKSIRLLLPDHPGTILINVAKLQKVLSHDEITAPVTRMVSA